MMEKHIDNNNNNNNYNNSNNSNNYNNSNNSTTTATTTTTTTAVSSFLDLTSIPDIGCVKMSVSPPIRPCVCVRQLLRHTCIDGCGLAYFCKEACSKKEIPSQSF